MWGAFYLGIRKNQEKIFTSDKPVEFVEPEPMGDEVDDEQYFKHFREAVNGENGETDSESG